MTLKIAFPKHRMLERKKINKKKCHKTRNSARRLRPRSAAQQWCEFWGGNRWCPGKTQNRAGNRSVVPALQYVALGGCGGQVTG
jgi:hypothetical protein